MSPIDFIKEGILEGNWLTVCEGYERLTGEALRFPSIETDNSAQIKLDKIMALLAEDCDATSSSKKKSPSTKPKKKKIRQKKSTVSKDGEDSSLKLDAKGKTMVQKETNGTRLITNEPDATEIEENKKRAVKSGKNKLMLNRQAGKKYEVKCNECEKPFDSARPSGEMGQKCNKCLRGLKSRFA